MHTWTGGGVIHAVQTSPPINESNIGSQQLADEVMDKPLQDKLRQLLANWSFQAVPRAKPVDIFGPTPCHSDREGRPSHCVGAQGFHTDPTHKTVALLRQTLPCLLLSSQQFLRLFEAACHDRATSSTDKHAHHPAGMVLHTMEHLTQISAISRSSFRMGRKRSSADAAETV